MNLFNKLMNSNITSRKCSKCKINCNKYIGKGTDREAFINYITKNPDIKANLRKNIISLV